MRYLLVDRIIEWKKGEYIRGVKNVAMSEDFLEFHFPGNPIMPGVLLIEAIAQLTGWLAAASSDFREWFLLSRVHQCKFYGFALPGDQVELEVRVSPDSGGGGKVFSGTGTVGGKKKIVVGFEGDIIPLGEIEDTDAQMRLFTILSRGSAHGP